MSKLSEGQASTALTFLSNLPDSNMNLAPRWGVLAACCHEDVLKSFKTEIAGE